MEITEKVKKNDEPNSGNTKSEKVIEASCSKNAPDNKDVCGENKFSTKKKSNKKSLTEAEIVSLLGKKFFQNFL